MRYRAFEALAKIDYEALAKKWHFNEDFSYEFFFNAPAQACKSTRANLFKELMESKGN